MYPSHFIPFLAFSLGGGHTELHPATANLYLEVPEISQVLVAYEQAPVAVLFSDESIQRFAAKLLGADPESITFQSLLLDLTQGLRSSLAGTGNQVLDLIPEVEHLSLSISDLKLEGIADESLATKGEWLDSGLPIDVFLDRLNQVNLQLVMDFSSEEMAQVAVSLIREQVETGGPGGKLDPQTSAKAVLGGQDFELIVMERVIGGAPRKFWVGATGARMIAGTGAYSPLDPQSVGKPMLSENARHGAAVGHLVRGEGVVVSELYTHVSGLNELPGLLTTILDAPPEFQGMASHVMDLLVPGGELEHCSATRLVGNRFITESFDRDFGTEGAPQLLGNEAVTKDSFEMAPADAVAVWATHLDKEGMKAILMQWLAEFSGQEATEVMAALENNHGFRPDRDLIDPLGGGLVYYNQPFTGIGMPKLYVALELDDPEAFARGVEGLGSYLTEVGEGAVKFTSRPYRKKAFMDFSLGEAASDGLEGIDPDFAPLLASQSIAVGVLDDRVIISLSSMFTKREMKRLLKSPSQERHPLMESEEEFPPDIYSFGSTDYAEVLAGLYDSVRGFLPLIRQGGGMALPFEMSDMPSSDIFARYFQPTETWSRRVEGGVYTYNESSFGPEVLLAASSAILLLVSTQVEAQLEIAEGAVSDLQDSGGDSSDQPLGGSEAEGLPVDDLSRTQERLRDLKVSLVVYKSDVGAYPTRLAELLEPTTNFPSGFLGDEGLPNDGWGRAFRYALPEDGDSYRLWSMGEDGVDQEGAGDDVLLAR